MKSSAVGRVIPWKSPSVDVVESHTLEVSASRRGRSCGQDRSQKATMEDSSTSAGELRHCQIKAFKDRSLTTALIYRHVLVVLEYRSPLLVPV